MVPAARFLGLDALFLSRITYHILVAEVLGNEHVVRRWGVRDEGAVEHSGATSGTALTSQVMMATTRLHDAPVHHVEGRSLHDVGDRYSLDIASQRSVSRSRQSH